MASSREYHMPNIIQLNTTPHMCWVAKKIQENNLLKYEDS